MLLAGNFRSCVCSTGRLEAVFDVDHDSHRSLSFVRSRLLSKLVLVLSFLQVLPDIARGQLALGLGMGRRVLCLSRRSLSTTHLSLSSSCIRARS